jgi:hypothetical protein
MNEGRSPTLIFEQQGETRTIVDPKLFNQLMEAAAQ